MTKKRVAYLLVAVVAVFAVTAAAMYFTAQETSAPGTSNDQQNDIKTQTPAGSDAKPGKGNAVTGRYVDYSAERIAANGYDRTLLFFHAPWCPECRAYEQAIESGTVPEGVQILKVDYDSNTELRKQYGVTIQTTFVRIDENGNKQLLWSGYGKEKSVQAILDNTKL